jgi:sugar phosphate isomerase/epimerase
VEIGICSFSFHRLLAAGKQDIFQYIQDCKELGCTRLDPWNAHLANIQSGEEALHAGHNPDKSQHLSPMDEEYIEKVKMAADAAGLPFGCIAADGGHIYEPTEEARAANRTRAYLWTNIAHKLGASQIRLDAGGPQDMPQDIFKIIVDGYKDIIAKAEPLGIQVLIENHWGPSVLPENVEKLIEAVPDLGLLYDTHNWRDDVRSDARKRCAHLAAATHVKTFDFDDQGNPIQDNVQEAMDALLEAGYKGPWGVESVPPDGDEYAGARRTIEYIKRTVAANS